ncbi:hypothetical protein [Marinagarivorans cellulosilyticus]|uniref:Uncharacterized protein n=1 Tax=Marinagarivorans cellulosilyticus TaxID=2721545 RepID=A0AAN1WIE6_9GAMM|nr:hypothetical protein [Marinagarivorans cellulosilyticus]BCD98144.1 hypothetical protein MARGE09_P2345 [Marinagarivorans cellulosilyticus]
MNAQSVSRFLKVALFTGCFAAAGILGPQHLSRHLDQFWVEEAHQALLTGLVDSRNYAWEHQVRVELCQANNAYRCLSEKAIGDEDGVAGWLSVKVLANGDRLPLKFYSFHSEYVALDQGGRIDSSEPLGFDSQGYSLQPEVVALQLYSWGGISQKNYTVVLEPSGALQTLVNAELEAPRKVALLHWENLIKKVSG